MKPSKLATLLIPLSCLGVACGSDDDTQRAQAADTGAAIADAGSPAADAAGAPDLGFFTGVDGGFSIPDSGVVSPPHDAGVTPPPDAGVDPADAGVTPPADAGVTPPADAGTTPPADAGTTPPADAGVAPDSGVMDAGQPADAGVVPTGVPVLGNGQHGMSAVVLDEIAGTAVGHVRPTDLAFHPIRANELWVTNQGDNSMWLAQNPGTPQLNAGWFQNLQGGGTHFFANPSSLDFGANGNFATSQDTDEITQQTTPADFMGPTLWSSDLSIFDAGHAGHLDMLHNSPNGKGIAWETGNAYWVFDGYHSSITRYDFHNDHGPGGADHSDGEIARYVEGQVQAVEDAPSHMAYDSSSGLLYIADTGNNRVAVLDTNTGTRGGILSPNYDGADMYRVNGASISTLVSGDAVGMQKPCGLELHDGMIFVSDNANGRIFAFDRSGQLLDYLDTGLPSGALMGLTFDTEGRLLFVETAQNRVLRLSPRP